VRGVEVSELELGIDGGITVKRLATLFEDGEVVGESYLASSLRKSVEARGPVALDSAIRLYNNGYYGASWVSKGRVYLKEGQEAPAGLRVRKGPRGGRYYETEAKRGRPLGKAPEGWKPQDGDRVRVRQTGDRFNGRLARVTIYAGGDMARIRLLDGIGGGIVPVSSLVPAPYTAKEKKDLTARDILVAEFGKTSIEQRPFADDKTGLTYDIYNTEAGPMLWGKRDSDKDKPWIVTKESAVSLDAFMKSLLEMPTEALQSMKSEIQSIIFSPVPNPADRKTSQMIGAKFVSAASMDAGMQTMYIWPASKESDTKRLAQTLVHETGHAIDRMRSNLGTMYAEKLDRFWDDREMPLDDEGIAAVEAAHGVPPDPNKWQDDWSRWRSVALGQSSPGVTHYWPSIRVEKPWRDLSRQAKHLIEESITHALPVSDYAHRNDKEYYAEAYTHYQLGTLADDHMMYTHFDNLERTKQWLQQ